MTLQIAIVAAQAELGDHPLPANGNDRRPCRTRKCPRWGNDKCPRWATVVRVEEGRQRNGRLGPNPGKGKGPSPGKGKHIVSFNMLVEEERHYFRRMAWDINNQPRDEAAQ